MNAPVLINTQVTSIVPGWRGVALPLGLGLLLLGAIFKAEIVTAVRTWQASTAYNHCFLVIPIVLYLLWDRRKDLSGIQVRSTPVAALLGLPLAAVWLIAERLGIMEGRQLAALSFAELLFLAVLGKRLWQAMSGPLLYLYFLVPFGEFLTPKLQDVTTFFIRHGLEILNVPAYIDGYVIEIPQGTFFVAEACAGLRFLIASIAFSALYALMMYRSPLRRGVFILVSVIVPVFANGLRGLGIVYLGYLLNSTQAAAADHVIYGWVFFSLVMLMLISLGLPFRQDELPTRRGDRAPANGVLLAPGTRLMVGAALAVSFVAVLSPALALGLSRQTSQAASVPSVIDVGPGCTVHQLQQAAAVRTERVRCGDVAMDLAWQAFSPRVTAAPVMAARRQLCLRAETESLSASWLTPQGPGAWRIMSSNDPVYLTAVSVWVDGQSVRPGLAMRARMAMNSLVGSTYAPIVLTVTPAADWGPTSLDGRAQLETKLRAFLLTHPALATTVGSLSEQR